MKHPMYKTSKKITILYDQEEPISVHVIPSGYHDCFIVVTEGLVDIETHFMSRNDVIERFGKEVLTDVI